MIVGYDLYGNARKKYDYNRYISQTFKRFINLIENKNKKPLNKGFFLISKWERNFFHELMNTVVLHSLL